MRRTLLFFAALALACNGGKSSRKLVLLHTNDEHSHLIGLGPERDDFPTPSSGAGIKGGASRRSVVLASERTQAKNAGADSLTVSAGDNMSGSLVQIAEALTAPDFRSLKLLKYDVTTLGNHEFDYGPAGLAAILSAGKASAEGIPPIVATNTHFAGTGDSALQALFDSTGTDSSRPIHGKLLITTPNGLRVGFVGIMGADAQAVAPAAAPTTFSIAPGQAYDNRIANLSQIFHDIQPVVDSLRRDDHADLVVALSHSGVDLTSPDKSEDVAIAQNVSGLDVIISGHSHTDFPAQTFKNIYTGKDVLVQQAGRFGDQVGRIYLTVNGDGTVSFDMPNSHLVPVNDSTPASDDAVNKLVSDTVGALEAVNLPGKSFSFMQYTLTTILGAPPPAYAGIGSYYNFDVATLPFDVDNSVKFQETELLDLITDANLAAANQLAPTELSAEGYGATRVPALLKGKSGKLGFADLFAAVPLGGSPAAGTPGYPLCRFGVYLAEVKAAFEITAAYAYTGHEDFFLVPSGFKFQYDTTRQPFNSSGDSLDRTNGRVTKIWELKPDARNAGVYDGPDATTWDLKFDASQATSVGGGLPAGWFDNPLRVVSVVSSYYIASFATFAGVHLKDPDTGAIIPGNNPAKTIMSRPAAAGPLAGTEIKEWEALAGYLHAQPSTTVPARYNKADATNGAIPRRAICVGANATNGNCAH